MTLALVMLLSSVGILSGCAESGQANDTDAGTSAGTAADTSAKDTDKDTDADTTDDSKDTDADTSGDNKDDDTLIETIKDITPSDGKKVRIAFIGDSITEGAGVGAVSLRPVDGYPGQLQNLLGSDYVVGNFGKSSAYTLDANNKYNVKTDATLSYRNTQQYKDSLKFGADVVVVMMGVNDIRSMSCDDAALELKKALRSLVDEYASLDTVQKVYVATSIYIPSSATIYQYCDGVLQALQREVADEGGYDVIDMYAMTRDYFISMMHYTSDIVHPNKELYGEMAKAFKCSLMGEKYTAPIAEKSQSGVVFVKTGGATKGQGATPATAIDSIAKAAGLLRESGGTIVICGKYSLKFEAHMPINDKRITITSVYDGVDYQKTNSATLGIAKNLYFYGDYTIENVTIVSELANSIITCNYNNVTFGDGIKSTLGSGITTYPLILVGYNVALGDVPVENITLYGECNIIVNSGTWSYLRGGNRREKPSFPMGGSDKNAVLNITINGGTFMNATGTNLTAGTGMGSFAGKANFTINGGEFRGNVYAVGRAGTNSTAMTATMSGEVVLTVTGGTFKGSIYAVQDNSLTVTGKYSAKVTAALKNKLVGFTDITVIE